MAALVRGAARLQQGSGRCRSLEHPSPLTAGGHRPRDGTSSSALALSLFPCSREVIPWQTPACSILVMALLGLLLSRGCLGLCQPRKPQGARPAARKDACFHFPLRKLKLHELSIPAVGESHPKAVVEAGGNDGVTQEPPLQPCCQILPCYIGYIGVGGQLARRGQQGNTFHRA